MANVKVLHAVTTNATAAAATTYYIAGGTGIGTPFTSESDAQLQVKRPRKYENMFVSIRTNTHTTSSTLRIRINGANGNQTITIPAGATGYFEDSSNSDNVVLNDLVNYSYTTGTSGSSTFGNVGSYISNDGYMVTHLIGSQPTTPVALTNAGTTQFVIGQQITTASSAGFIVVRAPVRVQNVACLVTANTLSGSTTVAGAVVPAGATGRFIASGHTDYVSGNNITTNIVRVGTGSITIMQISAELAWSTSKIQHLSTSSGIAGLFGGTITRSLPFSGHPWDLASNPAALKLLEPATVEAVLYKTQAHGQLTVSGINYAVFKNGATTGMTWSEAVNTFGNTTIENTANPFTVIATDTINYNVTRAGGSNGSSPSCWSLLVDYDNYVREQTTVANAAM